jgi:4-alpha-glucanotransferase
MTDWHKTLQILAEALGVEPKYTDNWGRIFRIDDRTALRLLRAKGLLVDSSRLELEPQVLVVSRADVPPQVSLYFRGERLEYAESSTQGTATVSELEGRLPDQQYSLGEDRVSLKEDDQTGLDLLTLPFPSGVELGKYEFNVDLAAGPEVRTCKWILFVCPEVAYLSQPLEQGRRLAGVGVALYGVRSRVNWGVGDFSDLKEIIDWARDDLGADFVGLNPLHAIFNQRPYNSSPYLPSSRFYRNFIYLDVPSIPEFAASDSAKAFVDSKETRQLIERLQSEEHVNYEEVSALKLRVLKEIFSSFMEDCLHGTESNQRWTEFQHYCNAEGVYLDRFATFCALREHLLREFPEAYSLAKWPAGFRDPSSLEVKAFQEEHSREILFWMYVQWQLDEQLRQVQDYALSKEMLVGLYHDEALAVDRDGADFWAWRSVFVDDFRVGAPPDAFAPDGQDWGFPPPDRDNMRQAGYDPFLRKLSASSRHCGALRIDHVMQFHHLFWIPSDGVPADGVYVRDHESDLLNLVALESHLSRTLIVGEDLGTVPFDFRDRLMKKGVFSYRLFYFERDSEQNLRHFSEYPRNALVSITTHDLPTLAGFWSGQDIDLREKIGQLDEKRAIEFREERTRHKAKIIERLVQDELLAADTAHTAWEARLPTEELHSAVLRFLFQTPSILVQINQEDIFLDHRQQNIPGTTSQHPNWVTKMRFSVEELKEDPEAILFSKRFMRLLQESGRS